MSNKKFIVGLTGGIASGKSTVSKLFEEKGIDVIDADIIAREVVEPGTAAFSKIVEHFGNDVVNKAGELDRPALRTKVFANENDKRWLNSLLHPLIRETMLVQCHKSTSAYCILAVPLLIENGLNELVDRVLVVDIPEDLQLERAMSRDNSDEKTIKAIIDAQINRKLRLDAADDVIDNRTDISNLITQVTDLHHQYLQYSKSQ